ncbi:hypothetical protein C7N43_17000 [Sphingobacteriales bacterium UPWRP_1]|nr:hypothetical protein BVG80_12235 [Sphingobacteriales bacterium TSM_CSM]PSJ75834.1 hypothetical protein C7N43_17000 [Sphingobacteriales bacterium UPWRP_1]
MGSFAAKPNTITMNLYRLAFCVIVAVLLGCCRFAAAQSLSVKDITQFFSPSVTLRSELILPSPLSENDTILHTNAGVGLQANIPLKGKIEFDLNLGKLKNLKNIKSWTDWQNISKSVPVDIRAYQLFLTLGGGYRNLRLDYETEPHRLPYVTGGVMGIHLQKKLKFLFYSANLLISEDINTLNRTRPFFNGFVGQARLYKFSFLYYYGLFLSAGNKRVLPVPFAGISAGLPGAFNLQVILPLEVAITYRKNSKLLATATVALSGFTSGFENRNTGFLPDYDQRIGFANNFIKSTLAGTYVLPKGRLKVEAGAAYAQGLRFLESKNKDSFSFKPKAAPFVGISYQMNLGNRSLVSILFDKIDFKW